MSGHVVPVIRLVLVLALASATGAAEAASSCLRPGMPETGIPEWKLKLVLAYPVARERGEMLHAILAEHYDINAIVAADGEGLVKLLVPGMLEAKTSDALVSSVAKAMNLLECDAAADATARPLLAENLKTMRARLLAPEASPVRAASDARGQKQPTTSSELLAIAATEEKNDAKLEAAARASNSAIKELRGNVIALKSARTMPACCNAVADACPASVGPCIPLAERTEDLLRASRKSWSVIKQANTLATSTGASGEHAELIKTDFATAKPLLETAEGFGAARLPRYGLYVGPSYSLKGDGGWHTGSEFMARFESAVHDRGKACWFGAWCRTASEFSYRRVGAFDEPAPEQEEQDSPVMRTGSEDPAFTPFTSSGGIFRFSGAYQVHFNDWFGLMGVAGLTAADTGNSERPELRTRIGAGFHTQTLYGDGALGQLYVGYMRDAIWQREVPIDDENPDLGFRKEKNPNRWVVDGLFFLPGIELGGFQVAARVTADTPINRRGPSDVRASLLFHYDLNRWIKRHDPRKSETN